MSKQFRRALCWIRRDIRLADHSALAEATEIADETVVVFVFDTTILCALADRADRRVTFIHSSLAELDVKLRAVGSALVVLHGDPVDEIPRLAAQVGADVIVSARDFEPSAISRDAKVRAQFYGGFVHVVDHVVLEPEAIRNQSGEPFRVFTPYSRAWHGRFEPGVIAERSSDLETLARLESIEHLVQPWSLHELGFERSDLWLEPGEDAARRRLQAFASQMPKYGETRDYPALAGTSVLSVHLRFGTLSIREAMRIALSQTGTDKWVSELIWREFYAMILASFPEVVGATFQPQYRDLVWPGCPDLLDAWKNGQTGFPIVDAAMRCLNKTGWMHNRLRMVVASFLTKDLLLDYRLGEAYFAEKLLDFDLASNNGGWQWAASTGVDAQPYFRVFNPVLQSKKFDPEGQFIRCWCPELVGLSNERVHWPVDASAFEQMDAGCIIGEDYPSPIVDHSVQKELAIKLFTR